MSRAIERCPLRCPRDLAATIRRWSPGQVAWLDSAAPAGESADPPPAGCSLIAGPPVGVLEQHEGQPARLVVAGRVADEDRCFWTLWRRTHERLAAAGPASPLGPGWTGYLGFEMARTLERLPANRREPLGMPQARLVLHDSAVVLGPDRGAASLLTCPGIARAVGAPPTPVAERAACWNALAAKAGGAGRPGGLRRGAGAVGGATPVPRVYADLTRDEYEMRVRRALAYIAAGDIYQVNFAQRFVLDGVGDPLAHYERLRRANPAPYAAALCWDDRAVLSVSPERFVRLRGRDALTSPIKGTRPRTGQPALDAAYRRELLESEKDAAELAMIVDLHRNDFGRVCGYGSVRVAHARRVEAHPTIFHTVADVAGQLAPGRDALDLLAACMPAGSISGVPKIRALEIIDELEPVARGAYCGTILHLTPAGDLTANVAIRTLQIAGSRATLYVGGGIVADSDPQDEYDETLAKARGMLAGMGVDVREARAPAPALPVRRRRAANESGRAACAAPQP